MLTNSLAPHADFWWWFCLLFSSSQLEFGNPDVINGLAVASADLKNGEKKKKIAPNNELNDEHDDQPPGLLTYPIFR